MDRNGMANKGRSMKRSAVGTRKGDKQKDAGRQARPFGTRRAASSPNASSKSAVYPASSIDMRMSDSLCMWKVKGIVLPCSGDEDVRAKGGMRKQEAYGMAILPGVDRHEDIAAAMPWIVLDSTRNVSVVDAASQMQSAIAPLRVEVAYGRAIRHIRQEMTKVCKTHAVQLPPVVVESVLYQCIGGHLPSSAQQDRVRFGRWLERFLRKCVAQTEYIAEKRRPSESQYVWTLSLKWKCPVLRRTPSSPVSMFRVSYQMLHV